MVQTRWKPDATFYPSPALAAEAAPEKLAYVATFWRGEGEPQKDALAVVDVDAASPRYGQVVGWCEMPNLGDELHHHGWNACSSALCPNNAHPHVERRYLLMMGLRSSRIHFVDVKDDPENPKVVKVIEPDEYQTKTGYSRPHTAHCGPEGIYITNLGAAFSDEGPGGIALLDHDTFEVIGQWEKDRGPQYLAYDFWWHINHDVVITSEWGTPSMIENGVVGELLLGQKYGHRIHFVDVKDDPENPKVVKVIEPDEYQTKTGYSRPHTAHCGPEGIYITNLGAAFSDEGPGGIALLDHDTFEVIGQWEKDRGPQYLAYDFWWHINHDIVVTSEWGTPSMIEDGVVGELLLGQKYGHRIHFFDMRTGKHLQEIDLGAQHQMSLELRPAHDPTKQYGFVGVVVSTEDLSASIWLWHREGDRFEATKVITIPAEPADPDDLPDVLKPFGAVPPLVTDIDLSVDDKYLYVSCFGTGEAKQYDVSDPFHPVETGSLRVGGIASRAAHPSQPDVPLRGAPQMVEVSRDGKRVFWTNSLYGAWDDQFYPAGVGAWMIKADVDVESGGMTLDPGFFPHGDDFRGNRVHQTRLQGGDASSDSYCFP